ncbi:MAG: 5'-nucleotidase [Magnetococcales bacterium]|nr:5'-nucleotidase [Magnetococcales bacterium]
MDKSDQLIVTVSSRALFDLDESHALFERAGVDAYREYQIRHEDQPLEPGSAFPVIQKLLALNHHAPAPRVEVVLLSRNSSDTGLRIFKSIQHHGLAISRAAFTTGATPYRYAAAFGSHLFLSSNPEDVRNALQAGLAAATILPASPRPSAPDHPELRIAFDGDAVLFSDEAERIFQANGLEAFHASEQRAARHPLPGGPFKGFLEALQHLQSQFPADRAPLRTALITARSAPAHERVIQTLRAWNLRLDEALFLGGMDKAAFLRAFGADIFFDDQQSHCDAARPYVVTGHVPSGVCQQQTTGRDGADF